VVTDEEVSRLELITKNHNIPLIIDNAYGKPFPNAIFTDANISWNQNLILSMSLSKFGLPTSRTGIMIANKKIIKAMSNVNAILSLANSSFGQALTEPFFRDNRVIEISNKYIKPFYKQKSEFAKQLIEKYFDNSLPYYFHVNEGSFFFWLWLKDSPISSKEIYKRLKQRNVIVVPGEYFFPGLADKNWQHRYECIRINYSGPAEDVEIGFKIMAEEISRIYSN